nr:hypothetical protein [Pandoravirus massiliensis]
MADAAMAMSSGMRSRAARSRNHVENVEEDEPVALAAYAAGLGGLRAASVVVPRVASVAVRASPRCFPLCGAQSLDFRREVCARARDNERARSALAGTQKRKGDDNRARNNKQNQKKFSRRKKQRHTARGNGALKRNTQTCAKV